MRMSLSRVSKWVAVALCLASVSMVAGKDLPAHMSDQPTIGEVLYVERGCYQCHGLRGQGSVMSGPALVPLRLTREAFAALVRNPPRAMPPYSKASLSDAELLEVERYVRSFPTPRRPAEIPLLAQQLAPPTKGARSSRVSTIGSSATQSPVEASEGAKLYEAHCAACHGANRTGGVAPSLLNERQKREPSETASLIKFPPPGMPGLHPDVLSSEQVDAVALYLHQ